MTVHRSADPSHRRPAGYSLAQIALHWIIAGLVLWQLVFGEAMAHVHDDFLEGRSSDPSEVAQATLHWWIGLAVLGLVVLRLALRLGRGAPAPAPGPAWQVRAATSVHHLFYLLLVLVPLTGLAAYYQWLGPVGELHELAKPVFIVLIALHAAAALWHQFAVRDGTLMRMVRPR
ncbi:cytochrome b [Frigidibacter sp. MR17.24]|uniref:cytochrome b n=1 Tax=Frigidibacter sp. MR17.24 TaxID=3127345 RepID=UPI003012B146